MIDNQALEKSNIWCTTAGNGQQCIANQKNQSLMLVLPATNSEQGATIKISAEFMLASSTK